MITLTGIQPGRNSRGLVEGNLLKGVKAMKVVEVYGKKIYILTEEEYEKLTKPIKPSISREKLEKWLEESLRLLAEDS